MNVKYNHYNNNKEKMDHNLLNNYFKNKAKF